jgi:hypothetical protein
MKPAKYHRLAQSDLISSAIFYDGRNRGLGERFLMAVEAAETQICENPLRGQPFEAGTRKLRVKKFPFAIIYKEFPDFILVFAVAHFSRKPGYWLDRL